MNLGDIESQIYDALNLGQNPDSAVQRRVRSSINAVYREVLTKKNIGPKVRQKTLNFNTVANTPLCVLPQAVSRIHVLTDRTNNNELDEYDLKEVRWMDPGLQSSTAIPYAYVIMNLAAPVATDPAAATQLFAVSDSASDGSGFSVNVEGTTSDGQMFKASSNLNGTTQVSVSTVTTWLKITKFYLSAPAIGHVSLKDSSGNVLGVISPGRAYARYSQISLFPLMTAVIALTADVELRIDDLANSADEPIFPEEFHDILVDGGIARDLRRRGKMADSTVPEGLKKKRIAELQVWMNKPTGTPRSSTTGEPRRRFSQLGPNFPPGT